MVRTHELNKSWIGLEVGKGRESLCIAECVNAMWECPTSYGSTRLLFTGKCQELLADTYAHLAIT